MASELTEYFVRHYTLVLDNDQATHGHVTTLANNVIRDSSITAAEWRSLDVEARDERFASEIGSQIIDYIEELVDETIPHEGPGAMLVREILKFTGDDLEWYLGTHYMPEDSDIVDLLSDAIPVHILGPNLLDQSSGSFHVHMKGCADVTRNPDYRGPEFKYDRECTTDVTSLADIVEYTYADQISGGEMTIEDGLNDFHVFPCVKGLKDE